MLRNRTSLIFSFAATVVALLSAQNAHAQTVGYSLEPGASYVYWDDDLGLADGWMYGGGVAFELGERIRLTPFYLRANDVTADPAGLENAEGGARFPVADAMEMDVRHYGVDLDIDLISNPVTPFIRLGGGILRFDPEAGERLDRLALSYGGGLRFGVGRASVRLSAEGNTFRLDPARLYDPSVATTEEGNRTNWVGNARVSIPISTQPDDRSTGLSTASAPVGVYGGELRFADEVGLDDQRLVGVRAGLALNPLVSLTGFYWAGVNDDADEFQDVRGYGAEARFQLGSGTGVAPFLIAGGGRIDYDEDAEDPELAAQTDRTALILGGGLNFSLTDRIDLEASVRDYLIDTTQDLEDVSDPGELVNNWMYTVGLTVHIGGATASERSDSGAAEERARLEEEIRRLEARDSTERANAAPTRARSDSVSAQRRMVAPDGRVITLPVLEEGAIYIRFGPEGLDTGGMRAGAGSGGATMSMSDFQRIIEEELDEQMTEEVSVAEIQRRLLDRLERRGALDATPTGQEDAQISAELMTRLDEIEERLVERMEAVEEQAAEADRTELDIALGTGDDSGTGAFARASRFDAESTQPLGGLSVGDDATQAVLGARFDFGTLDEDSRIRFVPELAIGFGDDDTSVSVMGNFQLPLTDAGSAGPTPYLTGGAGIFTPSVLGLTTGVGAALDLGDLSSYAEIQGINLFSRTRFLLALTVPL